MGNVSGLLACLLLYFSHCISAQEQPSASVSIANASGSSFIVPPRFNVRLDCQVSNLPAGSISIFQWYYSNGAIPSGTTLTGSRNESLNFLPFSYVDHPGQYYCRVTINRETLTSNRIDLAPKFIAVFHPRDRPTVQVVVGAPAELECLVNAPPDAELVTEWVTPADERIPGNRVTVRRHAPDSTIFHLESVSETDAGEYQCLVSSYTAGIDDATIRLEVVVPPVFTQTPLNHSALVGENLTLNCGPVESLTTDVQFSWFFEMTPIAPSDSRVTLDGSGTALSASLVLRHLTYADEGTYRCTASNVAGNSTQTTYVTITGPPQLTIPTGAPTVITASISQAIAMLDCPFLARPSASVTWTKDSQDLLFALKNKYMVFRNGSLLISYVMNNDSGSYTCSIVNLLGEARATYDLLIISPPQWPTAVQAGVQADNRSVSLSWEPPLEKPNQLVENYRVSVRLDGHTVQEFEFPRNNVSVVLTQLFPGEMYEFEVFACNSAGCSLPNHTSIQLPISAPSLMFHVSPLSNGRTLQFKWHLLFDGGPDLKFFNIRVYTGNIDRVLVDELTPNISTHTQLVEDLEPNTHYTIAVRIGNGEKEHHMELSTNTTMAPPSQPSTPKFTLVTTHLFELTFLVVRGSRPITHFILNITEVVSIGNGPQNQVVISVDDPRYVESIEEVGDEELKVVLVVRRLKMLQQYTFQVAAVSSVGVGEFSDNTDPMSLKDGRILYYIVSGVVGGVLLVLLAIVAVVVMVTCRNRHIQKTKRTIAINGSMIKTPTTEPFTLQNPPNGRRGSKRSLQSPGLNGNYFQDALVPATPIQVTQCHGVRSNAASPAYDRLSSEASDYHSSSVQRNRSMTCESQHGNGTGNQNGSGNLYSSDEKRDLVTDVTDNSFSIQTHFHSSTGKISPLSTEYQQHKLPVLDQQHSATRLVSSSVNHLQLTTMGTGYPLKHQNSVDQQTVQLNTHLLFPPNPATMSTHPVMSGSTPVINYRYSCDSVLGPVQQTSYMTDV